MSLKVGKVGDAIASNIFEIGGLTHPSQKNDAADNRFKGVVREKVTNKPRLARLFGPFIFPN